MRRSLMAVGWLWVLVAVCLLATAVPAAASYDKLYRFRNPAAGSAQNAVQATMMGLEVIGVQYTDPAFNPWGAGTAGYTVVSGVYSTTIDWGGATAPSVAPGTVLKLGWNSTDHSLQLRDLRWGGGASIVPTELGDVPGGGELLWAPETGGYVWRITNDTESFLQLTNVELGTFNYQLEPGELEEVATEGTVGKLIRLLRDQVLAAWADGTFSSPNVNSLLVKLDNAVTDNEAGHETYAAGNERGALKLWSRAAQHMQTFISELQTRGKSGKRPPPATVADWTAQAAEIIRLLGLLPEGDAPDLPGGEPVPPLLPEPTPDNPQPSLDIALPAGMGPGDSAVVHGSVIDSNGVVWLDWVDQVTIPNEMEPPQIEATFAPGPVNTGPVEVTLTAADADNGGIAAIHYGLVQKDGTFHLEAPVLDDAVTLTFDQVGVYELVYVAQDTSGNVSAPKTAQVEVLPVSGRIDTYYAVEGDYFLRLKTDGPGSHSTVSQTVTLQEGDILTGWAAFDAADYLPYNDSASVQILDASGVLEATPWYEDVQHVGNYGDSPWTQWFWTAPTTGTYTVQCGIANSLDSVYDSWALFDAATPVSNGSFETGNTNGWTLSLPVGGVAQVVTSHTALHGYGDQPVY